MEDQDKTKDQLIDELNEMRLRLAQSAAFETRLCSLVSEAIGTEASIERLPVMFADNVLKTKPSNHDLAKELGVTGSEKLLEFGESLQRLIQCAEEYFDLYDKAPNAYFSVDTDGNIIRANPRAGALLAIPHQDLVGKPIFHCYADTPAGKEKARSVFSRFKAGENIIDEELQMQPLGGDPVWISLSVNAVRDASGHVTESRSMAVDINERKLAEEELSKSEERYRQMFEGNKAVKLLINPASGGIVDANPAACEFYGYDLDSFKKLNITDINTLPPSEVFHEMALAVSEKRGQSSFAHRLSSGEIRYVEVYSGPVSVQGTELLYSIIQDVTSRKRAEDARQKSEADFRTLCEISLVGIWIVRDGKYAYVNPAQARILGYSPDELIGTFYKDYIHPDDRESIVAPSEREIGDTRLYSFRCIHKTGKIIDTEVVSILIEFGDQITFMGNLMDVTERNKAREEVENTLKRFYTILSSLTTGIFLLTDTGQVEFANQAFCDLFDLQGSPTDSHGLTASEMTERIKDVYADPVQALARISEIVAQQEQMSGEEIAMSDGRTYLRDFTPISIEGQRQGRLWEFRDITERCRLENERFEMDQRFRLAFANANVGVCLVDLQGKLLQVNNKMCEIFGYEKSELEGMTVNSLAHPDDLNVSPHFIHHSLEGEYEIFDFEKRYIHKLGHVIFGKVSSSLARDAQGKPLYFISHIQDISEAKRGEEELRQAQVFTSALLENILDGVVACDANGTLVLFNRAARRWHGLDPIAIPQEQWAKYYDLYCEDGVIPMTVDTVPLSRAFRGEELRNEGMVIRAKGQPDRHIIANCAPFFDEEGTKLGAVAAMHDITERLRAEQALRESEERYRRIVDTAREGIWAMDGAHITTFVNSMMAQMLGYAVEDMVGQKVEHFMFPEDLQDHQGKMEARRQGQHGFYERRFRCADGTTLWTRVSATSVVSAAGEFLGSIAMFTDISQVKSLQSQLLQSQKMEAVGTLAAGIAHDFNNMLQVILGYSDLLLNNKNRGEPGYQELEKIVKTSIEARDLVQKIRLFSRKGDIQPVPVDLNRQIAELAKLLSHTLLKTIDIDVHLGENLNLIDADPGLVDQMVTNLAINASEAMPYGGSLTIETQNILLDDDFCKTHVGAKPGPHVLLTISDTGKGMSQELMERIFEPFFSTKQRDYHRGTGLGLSIVKGIVDEHSGYITVESEVGKGTTFKICFPILTTQQKTQLQIETKIELATVVSETILLVEDEELVRDLGIQLLERFGYNVIAVGDGQEAVEAYARARDNIAMVILDIVMPRMDGKECLQELLRINPKVKALISSGVAQEDRVKEVVDLGARGSLLKPYSMKTLQQKVRAILDSK